MLKLIMSNFWKNEVPKGYYDTSILFDKNSKRNIQSNWHKKTFSVVNSYIKDDDIVLDFACGSGTFLGKYVKNSNSIGVDISKNQINYASKKYGNFGSFFYLENFSFEEYENHFDKITCLGLFEFITSDEAEDYLEKFKYCLKEDGRLILTTPNFVIFMNIIEFILSKFGKLDYSNQYKVKYNSNFLNSTLKKNGLFVCKIEKIISSFIFLSLLIGKTALKLDQLYGKLFNNKFGLLILAEIKK